MKAPINLPLVLVCLVFPLALTQCAATKVKTGAGVALTSGPPAGWPAPGPYNRVTLKRYPAYRSAVTEAFSRGDGILRLSEHSRNANVPISSPLDISGVFEDRGWVIKSVGFAYPNAAIGSVGFADSTVLVRDNVGGRALSYAWQGDDSPANLAMAKRALDRAAARYQRQRPGAYRLLSYDNPKAYELQALLRQ